MNFLPGSLRRNGGKDIGDLAMKGLKRLKKVLSYKRILALATITSIGCASLAPVAIPAGIVIGSAGEFVIQAEKNRWRNFNVFPFVVFAGPFPCATLGNHETFLIESYGHQYWIWGWENWWLPERDWLKKFGKTSE
jgi:hypothetical protein